MNRKIDAAKFKPGPRFKNTINENKYCVHDIKDNLQKGY